MRSSYFLFFIFFVTMLYANPSQDTQTDKQIIHFIFNAEMQNADSMLDEQIKKYPDEPKNYYLKMPLYYYSRFFATNNLNNDSLLQLVNTYADKIIETCKDKPLTPQVKFYLGSAYDYKTRLNRNNYWDAYWTARQCKVYLTEALEEDPGLADAKIGLANIEYFVANRLNSFMRSLVSMLGLAGDTQNSLHMFSDVAQKGELCKTEAQFILAIVYRFFENDYAKAFTYLEDLNGRYQNNGWFDNQLQQTRLISIIDEKGLESFTTNTDSLRVKYRINNSFVLNAVGYYYIGQENFAKALQVFKFNLEIYPEVANCYDSLAECYMRMGDNENAIKYYELASEKLPQDSTITEDFRERLRTGIAERLDELR